jgi:hypothetical protein
VLAPNAKLRALVVPQEPERPTQATAPVDCETSCVHHRPAATVLRADANANGRIPCHGLDCAQKCCSVRGAATARTAARRPDPAA